jgi:hypothetical protein
MQPGVPQVNPEARGPCDEFRDLEPAWQEVT